MKKRLTMVFAVASLSASLFGGTVFAREWTELRDSPQNVSYNRDGKAREGSKDDTACKSRHEKHLFKKAAKLLGITETELKEKVESGDNLYELLNNAGKVEEYKEILLTGKKSKLTELVRKGKMTQEEADEKYKSFEERVNCWDGTPENEIYYK